LLLAGLCFVLVQLQWHILEDFGKKIRGVAVILSNPIWLQTKLIGEAEKLTEHM
jgi:hypothetical protein